MGDFNAVMHSADRLGGDTAWYRHLDDFNNCIQQAELIQIPYTGLKFSWHNGQHENHTIQQKLDWIFNNPCLLTKWLEAHSFFHYTIKQFYRRINSVGVRHEIRR